MTWLLENPQEGLDRREKTISISVIVIAFGSRLDLISTEANDAALALEPNTISNINAQFNLSQLSLWEKSETEVIAKFSNKKGAIWPLQNISAGQAIL